MNIEKYIECRNNHAQYKTFSLFDILFINKHTTRNLKLTPQSFPQVPAPRVLRGRQEPAKDQQQGGRVERGRHLLPVPVRQEALRPQPEPGHYTGGEHYPEGHGGAVR